MRPARLVLLALLLAHPAASQEIVKRVGQLSVRLDVTNAYPGGLVVVRLNTLLGTTFALLNGVRVVVESTAHGPRALVPIVATAPPGPAVLGIELVTRGGGREHIPLDLTIAPHPYPTHNVFIPEDRKGLLSQPGVVRESRLLLETLRTHTDLEQWSGFFHPPVPVAPAATFGSPDNFVGAAAVDSRTDGVFGEYHRGLDFEVPVGTQVVSPAAGTVLLAGPLLVPGQTLVLDHGQGVVTALFHLSRVDVREGQRVEAGEKVALSGDSGVVSSPRVHWGVYLHGVAVDPTLLEKPLD